jgi:hypothetical protein
MVEGVDVVDPGSGVVPGGRLVVGGRCVLLAELLDRPDLAVSLGEPPEPAGRGVPAPLDLGLGQPDHVLA